MELTETKFKQTEVGLIPNDWEVKPFLEVSFMKGRIGWQGLKQTEFTTNNDEPFLITGMNFKDGEIRWNEVYHISEERYQIAKDIQLKKNDVLMTKDGTIGKLLYVESIPYPHKASLNSHLLVYRPLRNSYNPKYLYYQLLSKYFKDYVELSKSGTTFYGISQEAVGNYPFILPPLPEQKAIAQVLSDTDNLIQALEQKLTKKRAIKQGAMQQLLTPKEDWQVKKLRDLIHSFQNGYGFSASGYVDNGTPIVTMAQIGLNGTFQFNENKVNYWQNKDFNILKNYHLQNGDVIIAMTDVTPDKNLIGRMSIVKSNKTLLLNQRVGLLRIDKNKINPIYLKTYSNMEKWRDYCIGSASLGVQANIGTKDILNGYIHLPNIEEQTEIATVLSDMDAEIEQLEQKLSKYKLVKQGLMQNLLTGKIRLV
ncbi:restriction endonuclease [Polaribacter sp. BM10]|uniref:restriction endonuclease subunit S n=1 Tax=Polaribacter sp. BM10 TaxID=1529069 RepID=UPI000989A839|nr:restriction endonuclease subunit S [Polaribacter sp. BM10]AQS92727.1 restriction endonuclease [Polaribacter sp. BM10]